MTYFGKYQTPKAVRNKDDWLLFQLMEEVSSSPKLIEMMAHAFSTPLIPSSAWINLSACSASSNRG